MAICVCGGQTEGSVLEFSSTVGVPGMELRLSDLVASRTFTYWASSLAFSVEYLKNKQKQ